jgi:hypothetical protein
MSRLVIITLAQSNFGEYFFGYLNRLQSELKFIDLPTKKLAKVCGSQLKQSVILVALTASDLKHSFELP